MNKNKIFKEKYSYLIMVTSPKALIILSLQSLSANLSNIKFFHPHSSFEIYMHLLIFLNNSL